MGSRYDSAGGRYDYHLFLNHDGRYERKIRKEPDYERHDTGRWSHDVAEDVLELDSDAPDELDQISSSWRVLSVTTCNSNCLMVLRWLALASRNLPVLFYRVHCNDRGYGEGWQNRLEKLDSPDV
jgi:hypothetical protein